jgi:hypothetical protein
MNLQCRVDLAVKYKAATQIARVLTEDWCSRELYCPACDSECLTGSKPNSPAIDFECAKCEQLFQLKGLKNWNPKKVVDAGEFSRVKDLSKVPPSLRGWTLDVLSVIRRLGKQDFSLKEVYEFEPELKELHPRNENIRPKIRQQLQVLRDLGMIKFSGEGRYLLPS